MNFVQESVNKIFSTFFWILLIGIIPFSLFGQDINGNDLVEVTWTEIYTIEYDGEAINPSFSTTHGNVSQLSPIGNIYRASIYWTTVGSTSVNFYNDGILVGSLPVTVNPGIQLPLSSIAERCGPGEITLTATPGAGGNTCKWYSTSSGNSYLTTGTSYTEYIYSTYTFYVSSYNTSSGQESGRIGVSAIVRSIPDAAVSLPSQSICTSQSMATINITNPNGVSGTTFSWTVDAPGISGSSSGSGSSISQSLINSTNVDRVATYSITPATSACTGSVVVATVTIKPIPNVALSAGTQAICSNNSMTPVTISNPNGVSGTTFSWTVDAIYITGPLPGSGSSLVQTLTNTTNVNQDAAYTITPTANGCSGSTTTHIATVRPLPTAAATPAAQSICNGQAMSTISITNPNGVSGTTFSWTFSAPNITGALSGSGSSIQQSLTNSTTTNQTATYEITPTANSCAGTAIFATVTLKPVPNASVSSASQTVCSNQSIAAVTISNSNGVSGTTFSWTVNAPNITGASAGSGSTIAQTLTNSTNVNQDATYTITPTANGCNGFTTSHTTTVKPAPNAFVSIGSQTITSGQTMSPVLISNPNGISGTTFSWTIIAPGISGATSGNGNSISQSLTNTTSTVQVATYSITPLANSCSGGVVISTVNVDPLTCTFGEPITGAEVVETTWTEEYEIFYDGQPTTPIFKTNHGAVTPLPNVGTIYKASILWNIVGQSAVEFYDGSTLLASVCILVNQGLPLPIGSGGSRCGPGTVTISATPGAGGNTCKWYSANDPNSYLTAGTTFETPFLSTNTVYYVSTYNSSTLQESGRSGVGVLIKPIPDVLGSPLDQSFCNGQSMTTINISNPNGASGTTFSWTVSAQNITGPLDGFGNSIAQTLANATNADQTATYTITPLAYGCTGSTINATVTIKPVPSVAVSITSQTLCSEESMTNVNITNPNGVNNTTFSWSVSAPPEITGELMGTGNSIAQTLTNSANTSQNATYSITPSANLCSGSAIQHTVTVKPKPTVAVSLESQSICNSQLIASINISNPNNISATTFSWTVDAQNITGASAGSGVAISQSLTNSTYTTQTAAYIITSTANGCNGIPITSLVGVTPTPNISSPLNPPSSSSGSIFNYIPSSSVQGTTFTWQRAATIGIAQSSSSGAGPVSEILTNNTPDTISVVYNFVVSINGCGTNENIIVAISPPLYPNENYVITNTIHIKNIVNEGTIENLSELERARITKYFDGLGRPMQDVVWRGSPSAKDIVQPILYDAFGRESKRYLPIVSGTNGWVKPNQEIIDSNANFIGIAEPFYNNPSDKIADDARLYSETIFEPSPLNRPDKQYGPGFDWGPSGSNKYISHQYLVNNHGTGAGQEQVIAWTLNGSGLPIRQTNVTGYIVSNSYYATGQLYIKSTKDEHGMETREFTNKSGQVILKKVQYVVSATLSNRDHWAQTYYIYDDFGLLRYVLQPELSRTLHNSGTTNPTSAQLDNYGFRYKYDGRRRMTEKKVPGGGWVYMVYDNRDRLVLTQDAVQRSGSTSSIKYWTFTKYDELNRPILTGIKDTTTTVQLTQIQMQTAVDAYYNKAWAKWGERFIGTTAGNVHGYTNLSYPVRTKAATLDMQSYLTVTYYDDYSFLTTFYNNSLYAYKADELPGEQVSTPFSRLSGLVTGTKIKVLDGGVTGGITWLKSVVYYDDRYRVVQSIADNYKGGTDCTTQVYDFTGKVLKTKTRYEEYDLTWKDRVGVSVLGNRVFRSGTTTSGAASVQQLGANQDGWLEVTVLETNLNRYIGFNDANPDVLSANIDYAFYLNSATLRIYENNVLRHTATGSLVAGEVLRIERVGSTIRYYRNGVLLPYQKTGGLTSPLMVDMSLLSNNATLLNVRASFANQPKIITRRFEYDHAGRLLKTWHSLDEASEILLAKNEYNELGQLVDKKLHSTVSSGSNARQSIDYRYNIRGWLTKINESDLNVNEPGDPRDYFGMELGYNGTMGTTNTPMFNGNISAMKWSSNLSLGTITENAYNYAYDPLNRILAADFKERTVVWNSAPGNGFSESGYAYDHNGNINALTRKTKGGGNMDVLAYTYSSTNRLLKVADTGDKFKGFVDGANTGNDYTYDANGNMITDQNKGITVSMTYNFLNLPELITRGTGNTLRYFYDATGRKLSQVASYTTTQKQTDYMGELVFENDLLQFVQHEEGRINVSSQETIQTHHGEETTSLTATSATLTLETINGEKYVKATATSAVLKTGITRIGLALAVVPGERYLVRARGYRTSTAAVNLWIRANGVDQGWPGATLASSAATEAWTEQLVIIPPGATMLEAGLAWSAAPVSGHQFFLNEFEIVQQKSELPEYQYHLKDHLGNVRVTFTTKNEVYSKTATFETANVAAEQREFLYYNEAIKINHALFDHTAQGGTWYATRLTGQGTNAIYGVAKSLAVVPGDTVSMEVFAKYLDTNQSNWTSALASFMAALSGGTAPPGTLVDGGVPGSLGSSVYPFSPIGHGGETGVAPKAYLNYILFDQNMTAVLDFGFQRITTNSREYGQGAVHDRLFFDNLKISQPGYLYIYLSNENETPVEVYFDDFKVTHKKSPVIQSDDYYPFGLTFNSYNRENSTPNQNLYNGKELQDELSLNTYDFGFRQYDPAIARWNVVDPLSEKRYWMNPYNFVQNNPINRFDPNGLTDFTLNKKTGAVAQVGEKNDDPDRIVKTNRKGEVKHKKNGEAKVAVGGIEQGILKDGQNFKTQDQVVSVGGEGQASVDGVKSFTLKLSEYVGKEIKGFSYSSNASGNATDMVLGKYKDNTNTESYGTLGALQKKYGDNFSFGGVLQEFHTHPDGKLGATESTPHLSQDVTGLQNDKPFVPNASFIILYRILGQEAPGEYDYTHHYRPKKK